MASPPNGVTVFVNKLPEGICESGTNGRTRTDFFWLSPAVLPVELRLIQWLRSNRTLRHSGNVFIQGKAMLLSVRV